MIVFGTVLFMYDSNNLFIEILKVAFARKLNDDLLLKIVCSNFPEWPTFKTKLISILYLIK